jgi:hypothetical protein
VQTSDWISLGSLAVAAFALWRTEVARVQDVRTDVLKRQDSLRRELNQLAEKIPLCLQSRQRVASANGQSGAARALAEEVAKDLPELKNLRAQVDNIPEIPVVRGSSIASAAAVTLHALQGQVKLLTDKYAAAWAEDETQRERIWDGILARTQSRNSGGEQQQR